MTADSDLLRQYVDRRSEVAFAELVQRHLALVYHSAARQLGGDSHRAQDVAQSVFVLLAQKARSLQTHPSLVAWLHATTRLKVSEVLRAERRRQTREAVAHFMQELRQGETSAEDWERLRPMIDQVLLELNENDREAVLLRFFEGRPFIEIAAHLRLNENSAHKRVERALEKLRERLARRGVKSTASALAIALGSQAALAAPPVGLAAAVTGAAMSTGIPAVAAVWSAVSFMSTKTMATAAGVALLVAGGIATQQVQARFAATANLAAIEQENAALTARPKAEERRLTRQPALLPSVAPSVAPVAPAPNPAMVRALGSGGLASIEESNAFLEANPELREALVAYYRDTHGIEYADLIAALGLTNAERERFLAILATGYRRIVGEHQFTLANGEFSAAEHTRQLREVLGEQRYQQYRDFQRSGRQRSLAQELTRATYFTPTPLTPAQAVRLTDVVSRALADPSLGRNYTGSAWGFMPIAIWDRIVTEASSVLAEPQMEALRELQEQARFFHAQTEARKKYDAAQQAAGKASVK